MNSKNIELPAYIRYIETAKLKTMMMMKNRRGREETRVFNENINDSTRLAEQKSNKESEFVALLCMRTLSNTPYGNY